jgi:uncharacterized protein (TIRG00374 family)
LNSKAKNAAKLLVLFGVAGGIFWYLFKDIPWSTFVSTLSGFNYWWVAFSMLLGALSHIIRAYRWKLLLDSAGHKIWVWNSIFAVFIGYLVNSIIPRLGEITRCGIINRKENIGIPFAIGTLITERFIDLIILMVLVLTNIILEFNLIEPYWMSFLEKFRSSLSQYWWILLLGSFGLVVLFWLWKNKNIAQIAIIQKIETILKQGFNGIKSISKTKRPIAFWVSTLSIWLLYYLMMYLILQGSEDTSNLGLVAGLSVLVLGSFGMASPTPNGLGAFHLLVGSVLVFYGIANEKGIIIATILHTSQFITILVLGSVSLLLVNTLKGPTDHAKQR